MPHLHTRPRQVLHRIPEVRQFPVEHRHQPIVGVHHEVAETEVAVHHPVRHCGGSVGGQPAQPEFDDRLGPAQTVVQGVNQCQGIVGSQPAETFVGGGDLPDVGERGGRLARQDLAGRLPPIVSQDHGSQGFTGDEVHRQRLPTHHRRVVGGGEHGGDPDPGASGDLNERRLVDESRPHAARSFPLHDDLAFTRCGGQGHRKTLTGRTPAESLNARGRRRADDRTQPCRDLRTECLESPVRCAHSDQQWARTVGYGLTGLP